MSDDTRDKDKPQPKGWGVTLTYSIDPSEVLAALQRADEKIARQRAELDRRQRKERYDQVIARYNRAHGQNPKITLADVCAEMGESYEAVRKYRQRSPKHKTKK